MTDMRTAETIKAMFLENTGTHMLDSGGAYGRHWERNQTRDFDREPEVEFIDGGDGFCYYVINSYKFLLSQGMWLDEVCDEFNAVNAGCDNWDGSENHDVYGVSAEGMEVLERYGMTVGGSFNTYNGDSSLDQVLQGTLLDGMDDQYILLQVHQGCDVRGGYTDARLFCIWEPSLFEDVWGTVIRGDEGYAISNGYDGLNLHYEDTNEPYIYEDGDKVYLHLSIW